MTTFVGPSNSKGALLALKRLLHESEQRVPGCLAKLEEAK